MFPTLAPDHQRVVVMKSRKRPFQKGILNHCYQPSADGGVLFYSYSDYLVWFTNMCVAAPKHRVTVVAACPMADHVHLSVYAENRSSLAAFMHDLNMNYALHFNKVCSRTGPVFRTPFGSVPKAGAKKGRTNIIYVLNNPVERQLVSLAEDYRWNFLAYAKSDHPFSRKLVIRKARRPLQNAVREVRKQHKAGLSLKYRQLKRMFAPLTQEESQQLTDFIISTYNVIDYDEAIRFFDSYEDLITAVHSTTGSEYNLNETFIGKSDAHYTKMAATVLRELKPDDIHDIVALDKDRKFQVFQLLRKATFAMTEQIAKFLHMPIVKGPVDGPY